MSSSGLAEALEDQIPAITRQAGFRDITIRFRVWCLGKHRAEPPPLIKNHTMMQNNVEIHWKLRLHVGYTGFHPSPSKSTLPLLNYSNSSLCTMSYGGNISHLRVGGDSLYAEGAGTNTMGTLICQTRRQQDRERAAAKS